MADPRAIQLLHRLLEITRREGIPVGIGGGLAVNVHGVERQTTDVDAFFLTADRPRIVRALRKDGFVVDRVFAPFHYFAFLPEHGDPRVRIDLLFPQDEPELSAVERPVLVGKWDEQVPAFPVELLVLSKFYSNQALDLWDITALYEAGAFEPETVRAVLATIDPAAVVDFDSLMTTVRLGRGGSRPRPPRRNGG